MQSTELKPGLIVRGSILPEPVRVIKFVPMADSVKLVGEGMETGQLHQPVLTPSQIAELEVAPEEAGFDGDPGRFRLGVEAMRLGLAYEYDLSLLFIPSALATNGSCKSYPYACALDTPTDIGRESKVFCGGQNKQEGQAQDARTL